MQAKICGVIVVLAILLAGCSNQVKQQEQTAQTTANTVTSARQETTAQKPGPPESLPALPETGKTLEEFIPEGWYLLDSLRLDFNGDGKSDYSSPYELRAELATIQLDFSIKTNRFKLGRALYHIAQRRGFKSSKGETLKEKEETTQEINITG